MKQSSSPSSSRVFDLLDALNSPIITFTTLWADCIPKRILDTIPIARMKALAVGDEMATLPEVSAYIMTRTFESPMSSEWVNIYTWVSCTVCEEYFKEDHWKEVTHSKNLSSYELCKLTQLRRWIYEKRRKALDVKIKNEKKLNVPDNLDQIPINPLKQLQLQFEF